LTGRARAAAECVADRLKRKPFIRSSKDTCREGGVLGPVALLAGGDLGTPAAG
jgi:hypothetical protein